MLRDGIELVARFADVVEGFGKVIAVGVIEASATLPAATEKRSTAAVIWSWFVRRKLSALSVKRLTFEAATRNSLLVS